DVARQQQDREAVDGGCGGASQHVRRTGANRRSAGKRLQAVLHLRVTDRDVHLCLFVARLVVAELRRLLQRLPEARQIAVTEDTEAAGEERPLNCVSLY